MFLPRPVQVATCATALLASLLLPLLAVDVPTARAPLTLFNWRYGHLLNFNGLTQTVLLRVADRRRGVAVRARRPAGVGRARMTAQRGRL